MPAFNYAAPSGYTYHKIDPSVYKFSKHPAFNRPPTPPVFKPPVNPFAQPEEVKGAESTHEQLADQDEVGQDDGEAKDPEPEDSGDAVKDKSGLSDSISMCLRSD